MKLVSLNVLLTFCKSLEKIFNFYFSLYFLKTILLWLLQITLVSLQNNEAISTNSTFACVDNEAKSTAAASNDDDDFEIIKYVGGKFGETVNVGSGKTRMSAGFYRYAREQVKIKKERE